MCKWKDQINKFSLFMEGKHIQNQLIRKVVTTQYKAVIHYNETKSKLEQSKGLTFEMVCKISQRLFNSRVEIQTYLCIKESQKQRTLGMKINVK